MHDPHVRMQVRKALLGRLRRSSATGGDTSPASDLRIQTAYFPFFSPSDTNLRIARYKSSNG